MQVYGGFETGTLKLGDRDPNPVTNGTTLFQSVFGSSEERILKFNDNSLGELDPAGTLDGFTLSSAFYPNARLDNAVRVVNGKATLRNLLFYGNNLSSQALWIGTGATVDARHCVFQQNVTSGAGAAVRIRSTEQSLFTDCQFNLNRSELRGGAVLILNETVSAGISTQASPRFTRCSFTANEVFKSSGAVAADNGGGAVYTEVGARFFECDFFANTTFSNADNEDFKFSKHALRGGAILYIPEADWQQALTVVNCRFFENTSGSGGAIFAGDLYVPNSNYDRRIVVANSSFVRNAARRKNDGRGGAIHLRFASENVNGAPYADLTPTDLRNNLFWENMTDGYLLPELVPQNDKRRAGLKVEGIDPFGVVLASYNTFEGLYDANQPNFLGNANNATNPAFVSALSGNLRLSASSLAIDAGTNVMDVAPLDPDLDPITAVDLDGNTRIVDGDGLGGSTIDRGAYEHQP